MSNVCINANIPFLQLSLTYQSLSQMEKDGYINNFEFKLDGYTYKCRLITDELYKSLPDKININNPSFYGDLYPIKAVIQLKEELTRARHEDIVLELEHLVNLLSPYNFITFTDKDIEDMRYEYCKWKKLKPVKRKPYTTSMFWWDLMNKPSDMRINKKDENKGDE